MFKVRPLSQKKIIRTMNIKKLRFDKKFLKKVKDLKRSLLGKPQKKKFLH